MNARKKCVLVTATLAKDFGNTDAWVLGFRWYPIMTSRGGLAFHPEYANVLTRRTGPVSGQNVRTSSFMVGFVSEQKITVSPNENKKLEFVFKSRG